MRQQEAMEKPQTGADRRGPFPWGRVIVMLFVALLLISLSVVLWVAGGMMMTWGAIAPLAIGLIVAITPLVQWLFPLSPVAWPENDKQPPVRSSSSQAQSEPFAGDIFHFDETQLPAPDEFYGREYERQVLITRTGKRNSTAIVGDYRIGKSWLMQYLLQCAPTHPQLGPGVRVGRLSATHPQSQTPAGFVKRAMEVLNMPAHKAGPRETPLERLAIAVRELRTLGIIPVLCIDEFAGVIGRPGFDKSFVMGLRAIAEDDGLVLITASRQSLHQVIEDMTGETSPLFNIMPEIALRPFTEAEATNFVEKKGRQAGFDRNERAFFLTCAAIQQANGKPGWPPLRLQLVGQLLLAEKHQVVGQSVYALKDQAYQDAFKKRVEEAYQTVVRKP